jgi:uncharacterized protein YdeI (YjbR/CyaY-like superfamily)
LEIGERLEVNTTEDFALWLEAHGDMAREIWAVIYKKTSGKQTVTYRQLVEVAICYGWIDVLGKSVDSERYALRFMPRRKKSHWTEGNKEAARRMISEGRMRDAGRAGLPDDFSI